MQEDSTLNTQAQTNAHTPASSTSCGACYAEGAQPPPSAAYAVGLVRLSTFAILPPKRS